MPVSLWVPPCPPPGLRGQVVVVGHTGAMSVPVTPAGGTATVEQTSTSAEVAPGWVTLVWDDPVNLMSYVTYVFTTYFNYSLDKAEELMLMVHNEGKAVVSHGTREEMERDVAAMHGFGLWATVDRS
ncbi:ATP-dependent Clp protease adapter protein ClpS [Aestuariimicrobium sp. T2.26MG-19.2B]|nr:ATP-dependent Clp protease adapter protein ClpS [Aestuariimicrobium sp. T2.26MG-19.2B]